MKPSIRKPFLPIACWLMAWSLPLHADSLTVEGDLNVEGAVGIGTDAPAEKLEVDGNVKVTGNLTTSGTVTAPSVTLPDGSTLTSARSTTLYNAAGQPVATVATDGKINFTNGVSIGTDPAAILTSNSTAYLNQTLANLGFRENAVTPTPVIGIELVGNIRVTRIVPAGTFNYVVGNVSGRCLIGGVTLYASTTPTTGFVAKLPQAGGTTGGWVKILFTSTGSSLTSVAVDAVGNVFVGGNFSGTINNVLGTNGINVMSAGAQDGLVVKLNDTGVTQWAKAIGNTIYGSLTSVAVDAAGNVFASGNFSGTINNVGGTSGINVMSAGAQDGLVVKLNGAGVTQWAKAIGNASAGTITSVAVDAEGNVFTGGNFSGTINNVGGTSGINVMSAGSTDGLVVKLNDTGVTQWAKAIGNASAGTITSVAVDAEGNVFTGGNFSGTINNVGGTSGINVMSAGSTDGLVVKLNGMGVTQWAKAIGNASANTITSVAVDAEGNVFAGGDFSGTLTIGSQTLVAQNNDGFIVKYFSGGSFDGMFRVGGDAFDNLQGIAASSAGLVIWGYMGGSSWPIGDTVIVPSGQGSFAVALPSLDIVTPPSGLAAALAWGGGEAKNQGIALGVGSYASGSGSAAIGTGFANAPDAFSAGSGRSSGTAATAMGSSAYASGYGATAIGVGTNAGGFGATAVGDSTNASGDGATAIGSYASATGHGSTAMGDSTSASGYGATAIGLGTNARGRGATAMGDSTVAQAAYSTALGFMNVPQGSPYIWIPTDDLLVIGNGDENEWTPGNAFVVHKNGNVRAAGNLQSKGGFRTPPMGDLSMGGFTAGSNPADSETGLNAGLRYPNE